MRVTVLAVCAAAMMACGGGTSAAREPKRFKVLVPARSVTAGDQLLRYVPSDATLLMELDIRRLRENPVLGPVIKAWLASQFPAGAVPSGTLGGLPGGELVAKTDLVVIAAYKVGTADAGTLTLARGAGLRVAEVPKAVAVDATTVALGPRPLLERVAKLKAGKGTSVTLNRKLMRARALAMPPRATTGALRFSAMLDFDARVAMARVFNLDSPPALISVWGDVIDDLAVVALLGGTKKSEATELARAASQWRDRVVRHPLVRRLLLSRLIARNLKVRALGAVARLVFVIDPRRLQALAKLYLRELK